jgi:hypothetical protein
MLCLNKAVILKKHTPIYRTYYDIENIFFMPCKFLFILDGILSHPFLKEQLRNIGFEVKKPIETKKIEIFNNE